MAPTAQTKAPPGRESCGAFELRSFLGLLENIHDVFTAKALNRLWGRIIYLRFHRLVCYPTLPLYWGGLRFR